MCCQKIWQRIIPFVIAGMLGVLITGVVHKIVRSNQISSVFHPCAEKLNVSTGNGIGYGNGSGGGSGSVTAESSISAKEPMRIVSKPRPSYTDAARQNQVTGVVRLKVTFLASGEIGSVTPVSGLSDGLTEQAVASAKQIKFEPQRENGVPQSVSKIIEYSFSIY